MEQIFAFGILGLVAGAGYAIAASGLVVTYATSNVFNIAHGAVGMFMSFVYWQLTDPTDGYGMPKLVGLLLVVLVAAPAMGLVLDRLLMRRLAEAPVAVSLVITVALLVGLIGAAQKIWPPQGRAIDEFFLGKGVTLPGDVLVSAHQLIIMGVAIAVAGGLYVLLNRSRTGIAMRATVDNRELLALHGARPNRLSGLSWALGSSLAALAGILLAPQTQLDYLQLTLLVVGAYAAAMVGRLKSLPLTFAGAIGLGLLTSYAQLIVSKLPQDLDDRTGGLIQGIRISLPVIFLFVVMLLLPQEKLRVGRIAGTVLPPLPSWRQSIAWGVGMIAAVVLITGALSEANTLRFGQALALSLVMLSLVLLTGYGGDVSLCQISFVGVGGLVCGKMFDGITPVSIVAAFVITAAIGAAVAVPALRLRGLYLGLGTLAVAYAMDNLVFQTKLGFGAGGGSLLVERPKPLGIDLTSERAFTITVAVAFVVMGLGVLAIRRGRIGRLLLAARDSDAACATLGFSTRNVRVLVFSASAGLAGVAGVFYAGMNVSIGTSNFNFFQSLPLLLLAVVGGVTSVSGALVGGIGLFYVLDLPSRYPEVGGLAFVIIFIAAVSLGGDPNGIMGRLFALRRTPEPGGPALPDPTAPVSTSKTAPRERSIDLITARTAGGSP